ncbi:MAG: nucleoside phosphorylase [Oscillospiraceae bacterium]|jgi:uridine phosphorylase
MALQYHIQMDVGDVAPYVLLPEDPARVKVVASFWDEAHEVAVNREYTTYTGKYKGMPISCMSTGMGCPSTAIGIEELARIGVKTFLRIGTCGTFQDNVKVGDMCIFDSACRYDGCSKMYAPVEFPAVADHDVVSACIDAAKDMGIPYHVGTTRTQDTFYANSPEPGGSFNNFWQSRWAEFYKDLKRLNVLGGEMETSIILVLTRIWGLRGGAMAVCLDNILHSMSTEDSGQEYDPQSQLSHSRNDIETLSKMGSEALYKLYLMDQKAEA